MDEKQIESILNMGLVLGQLKYICYNVSNSEMNQVVLGDSRFVSLFDNLLEDTKALGEGMGISQVTEDLKEWISHLRRNYREKLMGAKKHYFLEKKDSDKILDDIDDWLEDIHDYLISSKFVLIKELSFEQFLPSKLLKTIPRNVITDLKEGFSLVGSQLPTSGTMILLRAAEGIMINYYEKMTKSKSKKKLNDIIDDLERNHQIGKLLSSYLHYIRTKRNESAHSGKTFTQEEGEHTFLHVKGLLEEINTRKSRKK